MQCHDDSYTKALRSGLNYGLTAVKPYAYQENGTNKGNEWDILQAAAAYVGITKINATFAPFQTLLPSLIAGRIDMFPAHQTAERDKVISFSSPGYWYGPVIVTRKGNPDHISTFADLVRPGMTVATVPGSTEQIYLDRVGAKTTVYPDELSEYAGLSASRNKALLGDGPTAEAYLQANPSANIQILQVPPLSATELQNLGYGYWRFGVRKDECSLNLAISRGLDEIRANGVVAAILKKDGLGNVASVDIPGTQGPTG
jgi:ABC-type amino acid transport substrate-binding protein